MGDKAVGCIRNGLGVTVYGEKHGLSQDLIKTILGGAAGITGCGNIVDLNQVQNSPYFQQLLSALEQISP